MQGAAMDAWYEEIGNQAVAVTETIVGVSGDSAYDTKGCHAAAVVTTRKNAQCWKENTAGAKARNKTLRVTGYLGRMLWKK